MSSFDDAQSATEHFIYNADNYNRREYHSPPPRYIFIQTEPTIIDFIPFIFSMLIYALVVQTGCVIVKKCSTRFYNILVFLTLMLAPPFILLYTGFLMFPFLWALFVLPMSVLYYKINKKPLHKNMPRMIFNIFKNLFFITNIGICALQSFTILSFFFFSSYIVSSFLSLLTIVYFALLSRELVFLFSETMASNTGFYSREGIPQRNNNESLCMICTKVFDNSEPIHTLICNHNFHETCIKGWTMIAKKKSCPYCKKGVDLDTFSKDIWYQSEIWFYPLIEALRSGIVFVFILIVIIFYRLIKSK
ncbi:RING finger protein 121 [Vairimorpha necatrix]|uniref:RING finger protein 121 n=1 Tax=Vairimorpha necatrix TaxID=6039 RepID=A0AAX4JCG3_9MICR